MSNEFGGADLHAYSRAVAEMEARGIDFKPVVGGHFISHKPRHRRLPVQGKHPPNYF
jgi:hypothetical protein